VTWPVSLHHLSNLGVAETLPGLWQQGQVASCEFGWVGPQALSSGQHHPERTQVTGAAQSLGSAKSGQVQTPNKI
jgi:hypothetical protein